MQFVLTDFSQGQISENASIGAVNFVFALCRTFIEQEKELNNYFFFPQQVQVSQSQILK